MAKTHIGTALEETYDTLLSQVPIKQASVGLPTYTGESVAIPGEISVDVCYGDQKDLSLVVVKGGHNLFGRDSLAHFCLDWQRKALLLSRCCLNVILMFLLRD